MKIIGIKTNNGYYITDDLENKSYNTSYLSSYLIDGEKPSPTFHQKWVKISNEPTKIQKLVSQPNINERYELIDKSLSDKFKPEYKKTEVVLGVDDDYDPIYADEFRSLVSLYQYKSDPQEPKLEDVPFEYETITEIDEIYDKKPFSYRTVDSWGKPKIRITENSPKHEMIDLILTPSILIHTRPCKLTAQESYDIVRAHIKDNIDPKQAEITSDYDFCLTVKKRIPLAKPHIYQVDVNNVTMDRKRKPKYENRTQSIRTYEVFKTSPKAYDKYPVIKPFEGDNHDDLKENIDSYLNHLMSVINEPLKECECCNGVGVIINDLKVQ